MEVYHVMDDDSILRLRDGLLRAMRQGYQVSLSQQQILQSEPDNKAVLTQSDSQISESSLSSCSPYTPPLIKQNINEVDGVNVIDGNGRKCSSLPMILLPLPRQRKSIGPEGRLVMDLGGSNLRCALVDSNMEALKWQSWPVEHKDHTVFKWCASKIFEFLQSFFPKCGDIDYDNKEKELAFAFSFPIKQRCITEAVLLQWNKEYDAPELIGQNVVEVLTQELQRLGLKIKITCVVNDAVATMLAAQYVYGPRAVGVIIGTGTNASCCLNPIPNEKNDGDKSCAVAINLEWGRFGMCPEERALLPVNDFDCELLASDKGHQPLEKLTSGLFLPLLYNKIIQTRQKIKKDSNNDEASMYINSAKELSTLEASGNMTARYLIQRSVEIMAAAIIALRDFIIENDNFTMNEGGKREEEEKQGGHERDVVVAIDGSMYERYYNYQNRLRCLIDRLNTTYCSVKGKIVLTSGKNFSCYGAVVF